MNEKVKIFPDKSIISPFIELEEDYFIPLSHLPIHDTNTINSLNESGLDNIGELLLYCGKSYDTKINGIGKIKAAFLDETFRSMAINTEHLEKTIHHLKLNRDWTTRLIHMGIIFLDDFHQYSTLDFYRLIKDYDKTKKAITYFRSKNIIPKSSPEDKLLFEIPNSELTSRMKTYLAEKGIYTLNTLLNTDDWIRGKYVSPLYKKTIERFINKKKTELLPADN